MVVGDVQYISSFIAHHYPEPAHYEACINFIASLQPSHLLTENLLPLRSTSSNSSWLVTQTQAAVQAVRRLWETLTPPSTSSSIKSSVFSATNCFPTLRPMCHTCTLPTASSFLARNACWWTSKHFSPTSISSSLVTTSAFAVVRNGRQLRQFSNVSSPPKKKRHNATNAVQT